MARPSKARRICSIPKTEKFGPLNEKADTIVEMTLEEYETVRLIDLLNCTQEDCAQQMGVARTTVQAVYNSARRKLADMLVNSMQLELKGGNYTLCPDAGSCCGRNCHKRQCRKKRCRNKKQEDAYMIIAVTYENGEVFQHFGHCEEFKVYDITDGSIASSEVISTAGSGHEALAGFLKDRNVDMLICGGIGGGARTALSEAGIKLYPGAAGNADKAVEDFLADRLEYNPDTVCNHHHHEGDGGCHGEGHKCGEH